MLQHRCPIALQLAACNRCSAAITLVSTSCWLPFMHCSSGAVTLRVRDLC